MSRTEAQEKKSDTATGQAGSFSVSRVGPESILDVWGSLSSQVKRGLKHGAGDSITEREIVQALLSGVMELWAVHKEQEIIAGVVLQTLERERGKALMVVLMAGREFPTWGPKVSQLISDYADLLGAYTVEAVCRNGVAKWLTQLGWKRKAITMELKNGR